MFSETVLGKFRSMKTPFYYYDVPLLERTLARLKRSSDLCGYKVHYALKANANTRILKLVKNFGFGADCVSGNEVRKALLVGFAPGDIVFAGVGKADWEIALALEEKIHCFNCESLEEMTVIDRIAGERKSTARIALRINPDIDAKTHRYITTGLEENKFGINTGDLEKAMVLAERLEHVRLIGLHFHVGSQVTDMLVFKRLCLRVNEIQQWVRDRNVSVDHINVGGGLGIDYYHPDERPIPDFENYFGIFREFLEPLPHQTIHFELGRSAVAQCSSLISNVLYLKEGLNTKFVILDAGMTELIRPALYQSYHKIENLTSSGPPEKYDVVGPVCESSDCFGKAVTLPRSARGDLFAIRSTGAYGETMASRYNLRDLPAAIYSDDL